MSEFSIRRIDRSRAQSIEFLGSKPKFWFLEDDRRLLFKADDRGTGEDWAEVVACELCQLLGLPHVAYELAAEYDGERYIRPGVVCESMSPSPLVLVLGNEFLLAVDPQYPREQRFRVRQHTVEAICKVLVLLHPPREIWMSHVPEGIKTALDVFVGYVMLDAWIANQDRHHENWGAIWGDGPVKMRLAPTFDHGAALARNLLDSERAERLKTKDRNFTVSAFAQRGRGAIYGSTDSVQPLGLLEAFQAFAQRVPSAAGIWLERLRRVNFDDVSGILNKVPVDRMSGICRKFTLELLMVNRERLLELGNAL